MAMRHFLQLRKVQEALVEAVSHGPGAMSPMIQILTTAATGRPAPALAGGGAEEVTEVRRATLSAQAEVVDVA